MVDSGDVLLCPSCYQPEHPSDHSWLRFERPGRGPWSKPRITDIHGREVPVKPVLDVEFTNILSRLDEAWYGWFRWQLDLAGVEIPEYDRRPPPFEPDLSLLTTALK